MIAADQRKQLEEHAYYFLTAINKKKMSMLRGYDVVLSRMYQPSTAMLRSKVSVFVELYEKTADRA